MSRRARLYQVDALFTVSQLTCRHDRERFAPSSSSSSRGQNRSNQGPEPVHFRIAGYIYRRRLHRQNCTTSDNIELAFQTRYCESRSRGEVTGSRPSLSKSKRGRATLVSLVNTTTGEIQSRLFDFIESEFGTNSWIESDLIRVHTRTRSVHLSISYPRNIHLASF